MKKAISSEIIEEFFEGSDPTQYIVAVEANYYENYVHLIINDPVRGKRKVRDQYHPFLWMKESALDLLFNGDRKTLKTEIRKAEIKVKLLTTADEEGVEPERLANGFKFLVTGPKTYQDLISFFKNAGVDIFDKEYRDRFLTLSPTEQYLIQSGKRLFKGIDEYDGLHRLQFDLETTSLDPRRGRIFKIGMKDNRGFEHILSIDEGDNVLDRERQAIATMFEVIDALKPDIIAGYNSENFDWAFIFKRCEILDIEIKSIAKPIIREVGIRRQKATLKLGSEVEYYDQTHLCGYNIVDIWHSIRRAQAINSDIKEAGLKYITKFSDMAKPNRVYIKGDKIYSTANNKTDTFAFNNENGDWYKITEKNPLKEGYEAVRGEYIVDRYLLDDLWETEQIDNIFNQASFLLAKILPTSYMRVVTMGTATIWKLIMLNWSYVNNLAVPASAEKRNFTGGLSRLLRVGRAEDVDKLDYAALYPNVGLTWEIFPDVDITHVMPGLLLYIAETRDKYKGLKNKYDTEGNVRQAGFYDRKQMPLKILANSFFGSLSAPNVFPWADIDCGEEITCRGRMSLRLMVKYFRDKHGFIPLVSDTDGMNFSIPKAVKDYTYTSNGAHRFNEKDKTYTGVEAAVAEFNDIFMKGRMGLDIDEHYEATLNFSRKNYANKLIKKGKVKIKLVGNSIKSKKMPIYIEEFLDKAIALLLDGKGSEFVDYYYSYVDEIYNYRIPLVKIASKSKVKIDIKDYKAKARKKNKAGRPMPKQAHMELILLHELDVNLGDVIYYVNTGKKKGDGDIKTNKETGVVDINCKLIPTEQIENDPTLTTDEYNVAKYLSALNAKIKPLLVVFNPEVRKQILINIKKDKKTKVDVLEQRKYFNTEQCEMVAGIPYEEGDQDDCERDLMEFEDKEMRFWCSTNKVPNFLEEIGILPEEWESKKKDYIERVARVHDEDIKREKRIFDEITMALEIDELNDLSETIESSYEETLEKIGAMYKFLDLLIDEDGVFFVSKKHGDIIASFSDMWKFMDLAEERDKFYLTIQDIPAKERYNTWLAQNPQLIAIEEPEIQILEPNIEANTENKDDEWAF